MKIVRPLLAAIAVLSTFSPPSMAQDRGAVVQVSDDVQVLQAWKAQTISFDVNNCQGRNPAPGQILTKDCAEQAISQTRLSEARQPSPSAAPWSLPDVRFQEGRLFSYFSSGHLVEIRLLVKNSVLNSDRFTGIGFYSKNHIHNGRYYVPKSLLHIVNTEPVYLKSGEAASVLRFVLYMPGRAGNSGTGWSMDSVEFKPWAEFKGLDGKTYENWDHAHGNYTVFRAASGAGRPQSTGFDRQNELLAKPRLRPNCESGLNL